MGLTTPVPTGTISPDGRSYDFLTPVQELQGIVGRYGLGTDRFVDGTDGLDTNDGLTWAKAKKTIAAAITAAAAGDTIFIAPGDYDEALTITKDKLSLVGIGGRGAIAVATSTTNATALTVTAEDVTLLNVGLGGDGTGAGLKLNARTRRFRAYGCKFEGGTDAALLASTAADSSADALFADCEFAWSTNGLHFAVSGGGNAHTQIFVRRCRFHELTRHVLSDTSMAAGIEISDCVFGRTDADALPTAFLDLQGASDRGIVTRCSFATPSNTAGAGKLLLGAAVHFVSNYTVAGVSTGQPGA